MITTHGSLLFKALLRYSIILGAVALGVLLSNGLVLANNHDYCIGSDLDMDYNPQINGQINAQVVQPDGKILIGGSFTDVGGVTRNRIARLNQDGSLDTTFIGGVNSTIHSIILQNDGKILIGGIFNEVYGPGGGIRESVARLNSNGTLDNSFTNTGLQNSNSGGSVSAMFLQPDGKILIGGAFSKYFPEDGVTRKMISRLNSDGTWDSGFYSPESNSQNGHSIYNTVSSIRLQSDGKIIIGGGFRGNGFGGKQGIARLFTDGSMDHSFDPNPEYVQGDPFYSTSVYSLHIYPDDSILMGGSFLRVGDEDRKRLAKLNADGTLDSSFNPNINSGNYVTSFSVLPDNRILIGGSFNLVSGVTRNNVALLNQNGTLDSSFSNPIVNGVVRSVTPESTGSILLGGDFTHISHESRNRHGRIGCFVLDPVDPNPVNGVCGSANGQVYSANSFFWFPYTQCASGNPSISWFPSPGQTVNWICQGVNGGTSSVQCSASREAYAGVCEEDYDVDATFGDPNIGDRNTFVRTILVQPDGKVIVGGNFTDVDGQTRTRLARLNADATLDTSFTNPGIPGVVRSVVRLDDGSLIVGGLFTGGILKVNPNGTIDNSFSATTNGFVYKILLGERSIFIAGSFTQVNGNSANGVAKLEENGAHDTQFLNPVIDGTVHSMAIQNDGRIVVGGIFTNVSGIPRNYLARLGSKGTVDTTFLDQNVVKGGGFVGGSVPLINDIIIQDDNKILIGGDFTSVGGAGRANVARILSNGGVDTSFNNPQIAGVVHTLDIDQPGNIYIGGAFEEVAGQPRSMLARLLPNGLLDSSYIFNGMGKAGTPVIYDIEFTPNEQYYIGGSFMQIGLETRINVARLGCPSILPVCGNGIHEEGEECDDGNTIDGDGCSSVCTIEEPPVGPVCGNGILEEGEQCDDGNLINGDGCSSVCEVEEPVCGNGVLEEGEQCDDGNLINGDGCSSECYYEFPICGNGVLEEGEMCDDGNLVNGDGCDDKCQIEPLTCNSMFYDQGGPLHNYPAKQNGVTWEICPSGGVGTVGVNFSSFQLEANSTCAADRLVAYDGDSSSSTILGTFCGASMPPELLSTDPTGCLTFRFYSDNSIQFSGWQAQVTCETPGGAGVCAPFTSTYQSQPATNTANACEAGTYLNHSDTDMHWRWKCEGTDGGADAYCTAEKSYCGDGVCNDTESCHTCATDCGTCSTPVCETYTIGSVSQPATNLNNACASGAGSWQNETNSSTAWRRSCTSTDGVTKVFCEAPKALGVCGNSFVELGEECDDGNSINNDGCTNDCRLARCGDGIVQPSRGEECDGEAGCSTLCQWIRPVCSLNASPVTLLAGGSVDFGLSYTQQVAGPSYYACPASGGVCGDGIIDPDGLDNIPGTADDEQCDDGMHCENLAPCSNSLQCAGIGDGQCRARSGTGCSSTCKNEIAAPSSTIVNTCFNGVLDPGEEGIDCGGSCQSCN